MPNYDLRKDLAIIAIALVGLLISLGGFSADAALHHVLGISLMLLGLLVAFGGAAVVIHTDWP